MFIIVDEGAIYISMYFTCTCSFILHVFEFAVNILISIHLFSPFKCSVLIIKLGPSTLHSVPVVKTSLTSMAPQTHLKMIWSCNYNFLLIKFHISRYVN